MPRAAAGGHDQRAEWVDKSQLRLRGAHGMLDHSAASPRPLGADRQVPNLVAAAQLAPK
jgi:hypothetical protein